MSGDYFYEGADYGFDPAYGGVSQTYSYDESKGIGMATDPRTANQLKAVSDKLNTGANVVEVSFVDPATFETVPKEHFKELNRLRKLVGGNVELTLHAPLVEPTGLSKKGWDPYERKQAELQMMDAITKAHDLNPEGNVVTTFHASVVGLPAEIKTWEKVEGREDLVAKPKEIVLIDERSGGIQQLPLKPSAFEGKKEILTKEEIEQEIGKINKSSWYKELQHINFAAEQGGRHVVAVLEREGENKGAFLKLYGDYALGKSDKFKKDIEKIEPAALSAFEEKVQLVSRGEIYLRDAYGGLRELFDQAYHTLEKTDSKESKENREKLDSYRKKVAPLIKDLENPEKVGELAEVIREGVHVLRSIEPPKRLKPFKEFALEKSAETFGNIAFNAYKKFGDTSPIVSIENPPAGQAILTSGEDLRALIERSRENFKKVAMEKMHLSENEAKKQAEKLIGATWDVGHINQIRRYGAGEKELVKESEQVAKMVKHVHLSDNFGLENIELPMGMGNVPTKAMLKSIIENNKKFKKIVEVGPWYQHFQTTPFAETLKEFNSPIYAMKNASYWGPQGYFGGFGSNPDIHHAMYGAGFANLPIELGGQMSGRSRVSGNPLE
ncbi:MAG TPA: hypothetical protein VI544_00845 [Candidatus Nanoarchaeia archaeon]|nr:hypothetical protein [Candidatus Nanoarchaeia archaeon]